MAKGWVTVRLESLKPLRMRANILTAKGVLGECEYENRIDKIKLHVCMQLQNCVFAGTMERNWSYIQRKRPEEISTYLQFTINPKT